MTCDEADPFRALDRHEPTDIKYYVDDDILWTPGISYLGQCASPIRYSQVASSIGEGLLVEGRQDTVVSLDQ